MSEDKKEKKTVSRKWIIAVWAMTVGTLIIVISGFCALTGKDIPDGFTALASLLFSTGIAYIGGNVWQKQIQSKEEQ